MEIITLNTWIGSRQITTKAKELTYTVRELICNYRSTGKPAYWPTDPKKIPDILGFFVYRKVTTSFINVEENLDLNSDHSAVMLTLSERIIKKRTKPAFVNKTTDWESLKIEINNTINLCYRRTYKINSKFSGKQKCTA